MVGNLSGLGQFNADETEVAVDILSFDAQAHALSDQLVADLVCWQRRAADAVAPRAIGGFDGFEVGAGGSALPHRCGKEQASMFVWQRFGRCVGECGLGGCRDPGALRGGDGGLWHRRGRCGYGDQVDRGGCGVGWLGGLRVCQESTARSERLAGLMV